MWINIAGQLGDITHLLTTGCTRSHITLTNIDLGKT